TAAHADLVAGGSGGNRRRDEREVSAARANRPRPGFRWRGRRCERREEEEEKERTCDGRRRKVARHAATSRCKVPLSLLTGFTPPPPTHSAAAASRSTAPACG